MAEKTVATAEYVTKEVIGVARPQIQRDTQNRVVAKGAIRRLRILVPQVGIQADEARGTTL